MLYAFALLAMAAPLTKNLQPTAEGAAAAKTRHLSMNGGNQVVAQVPCAHVLLAITSIKNGDAESLARCFYCDESWGGRMSAHAASYHVHDTSFGIEHIYMDDKPDVSYNVTCELSKADCESAPDSVCDVVSDVVGTVAPRIIAEPSAKAAATHGAGSLIVGTLGVALVAALAVVKSRFGANAKVPTAPVLV